MDTLFFIIFVITIGIAFVSIINTIYFFFLPKIIKTNQIKSNINRKIWWKIFVISIIVGIIEFFIHKL